MNNYINKMFNLIFFKQCSNVHCQKEFMYIYCDDSKKIKCITTQWTMENDIL